jgi:hypothetical protein
MYPRRVEENGYVYLIYAKNTLEHFLINNSIILKSNIGIATIPKEKKHGGSLSTCSYDAVIRMSKLKSYEIKLKWYSYTISIDFSNLHFQTRLKTPCTKLEQYHILSNLFLQVLRSFDFRY